MLKTETEEDIDVKKPEVLQVNHTAEQYLYDEATPYRYASVEVLHLAQAFWIGPNNYTPESDAVVKAKSEWVQVHGEPLNLQEPNVLKQQHAKLVIWSM